jgi:hypothetical protein
MAGTPRDTTSSVSRELVRDTLGDRTAIAKSHRKLRAFGTSRHPPGSCTLTPSIRQA